MRFKRIIVTGIAISALGSSIPAASADTGLFSIAQKTSDSASPVVEALYHGVSVSWPTATLAIPFEESASGGAGQVWLWVEKLGKGDLSVEGGATPDRTWMENPELSDLVQTWEWQRFPIDEKTVQEGKLKFHASPWGDVYLGRAFFTPDAEALPPSTNTLQLSEETQLLQGRASYPVSDLSWGGAFIRILGPNGEAIGTSVVDRSGHFSALVPRGKELYAILLDRRGEPLTEKASIAFAGEGVAFQPLEGRERLLWLGDKNLGLTIRTGDWGNRPEASEPLCLLRMLDSSGEVSPFQRAVERESQDRNPVVVDVVFEDRDLASRSMDNLFSDCLRRLSSSLGGLPVRRILTAEGKTVGKALTLASEQRDALEGAIAWGGDPGEAVATNFNDCPVALLGARDDLSQMEKWIETCNAVQSPLLVASYWSDPDPETLAADVTEAVGWVNLPTLGKLDPKLDHSTYLSGAGRNQWIWIAGISPPGSLARVRAEWKTTGIINIAVENVDRVRVHLNCGLEKPGRQVTLSLETLTLPITLGASFDAIELRKRSDSLWAPRFIQFDAPLEAEPIALIPAAGLRSGEELKAFARFVRERFGTDCSWGYLLEEDLPGGPLSEIDLCNRAAPDPYVKIVWPLAEIERFHRWREEKGDLSLELTGYRPGVAESVGDASKETLSCAVASSELLDFFRERPESKTEFASLQVTQRELVGTFLRGQYPP